MVDQESPTPHPPPPAPPDDGDALDRALIDRIRAEGLASRDAWGELVTRYQDRLFAVCLRMVGDRETAADLTQDAFVKVLQGLDSFDARSRLSTWLIRVTMNVCLSHLRAAKLRAHASLDAPIAPSLLRGAQGTPQSGSSRAQEREPAAESRVERSEARRHLSAALSGLDPEQRAIIVLRDVQGLDYDQIGAALGLNLGTVKSRLFRARLALRHALEARSANPPSIIP